MVFVCDLLLKEANIHINLNRFDPNFDHPHIHVVTFVPENSPKNNNIFTKTEMFLLLGLSSLFSQNNHAFLEKVLDVVLLENLLKTSRLTALV